MFSNIENLLVYSREFAVMSKNQDSLFKTLPQQEEAPPITLEKTAPIEKNKKLAWEKELLGLYISGHPLDKHREKIEKKGNSIKKITETMKEGMQVVVAGIVEELRPVITKKGSPMACLKIMDFTGNIEVVIFPKIFTEYKDYLEQDKCIVIRGRISDRNNEKSIIAEVIKEL